MSKNEVVFLIHGTYAAKPDDVGEEWWQVGSPVYNELKSFLPKNIRLHENGEVFHWSGLNKQSERYIAGSRLLDKLIELEKNGICYHLVGHSHGGTIIIEALCESIRRSDQFNNKNPPKELELKHLLSWTTIGTPFLHIKPKKEPKPNSLKKFNKIRKNFLPFTISFFLSPLIYILSSIAIDADSIQLSIIFNSPLNMFFLSIPIVLFLIYIFFYFRNYRIYNIEYFIRTKNAMDKFSKRWLGLSHREDESIATITASTKPFYPLIAPRLRLKQFPWQGPPISNVLFYPLNNLFLWLYNTFAPFLDRFIIWRISTNIQGRDLPSCKIEDVSFGVPFCHQQEYLPTDVGKELEAFVIKQNYKIISNFRNALFLTSYHGFHVARFIEELQKDTGKLKNQMIHTSYFSSGKILKLIAFHIIHSTESGQFFSQLSQEEKDLWEWISFIKSSKRLI